ncbi:unnamed protein product [Prunus armeniaca]
MGFRSSSLNIRSNERQHTSPTSRLSARSPTLPPLSIPEPANCEVWLLPTANLTQSLGLDVQIREIIRRDTKKGGLYYVDCIAPGCVH